MIITTTTKFKIHFQIIILIRNKICILNLLGLSMLRCTKMYYKAKESKHLHHLHHWPPQSSPQSRLVGSLTRSHCMLMQQTAVHSGYVVPSHSLRSDPCRLGYHGLLLGCLARDTCRNKCYIQIILFYFIV